MAVSRSASLAEILFATVLSLLVALILMRQVPHWALPPQRWCMAMPAESNELSSETAGDTDMREIRPSI